ncbi:MAG: hypothetical protein FDX21_06490 [Chlorobium sp.]|nr:MAG: hypothetical protein FDX21_06490 [Chlorobium sp.]
MNKSMLIVLMPGLFLIGHRAFAEELKPAGENLHPASATSAFYDHPRHIDSVDKDGRQWQENSFGLSDSQKASVNELRKSFIQKARIEFKELFRLNHELVNESIKQSPNAKDVAILGSKIGKVHAKLASLRSNHIHDLSAVLSRQQMRTYIAMKQDFGYHCWYRNHHHCRDDVPGLNCKPSVN